MLKIGENIKELRKAQDVTQEKLADYLNISYQAVSKWENGLALPDITLLPQLANFFGVTADELLGVTKPEQSEELTQYEKQYFKFGREGKVLEKIALCHEVLKKVSPQLSMDVKSRLWLGFLQRDKRAERIQQRTQIYRRSN